jgi:AcrR family transcriptional regulator
MQRLPRGRHGLSPEFIAQNQRERLLAGLTEVLYEVGYPKVTVGLIGARAAVSKSDFYKRFESKDQCFDAAYEEGMEQVRERVREACEAEAGGEWALRVRAAVSALLGFLASQPALASLVLVEGLRAGRGIHARYQAGVESFVPYLCEGAPAVCGGAVSEEIGEAVVGGVAMMLSRYVLAGDAERLEDREAEVLEFVLAPYLGVAEARRIVSAG